VLHIVVTAHRPPPPCVCRICVLLTHLLNSHKIVFAHNCTKMFYVGPCISRPIFLSRSKVKVKNAKMPKSFFGCNFTGSSKIFFDVSLSLGHIVVKIEVKDQGQVCKMAEVIFCPNSIANRPIYYMKRPVQCLYYCTA